MSTWSTTTILVPCDYKNISGLPSTVDSEVNLLLKEGEWYLNGELIKISIDGHDLVVQSMVKYKDV